MLLTTLSAGAIVDSVLLTKFVVTGHYQVHPGILKKTISIQQSTWMEMALEDGSGAEALGGGVGCRLKIAVVVQGSGGGRRTCNDGIGFDVGIDLVKRRAYYYGIGVSIGKDGKRGGVQCKGRTSTAMARRR
jgi:hypothetical protein